MSVELEYRALIRLIKERRAILGMTQSALAKKIGVTSPAISQIERRIKQPSVLTLLNILQALGLIISYEIKEKVDGKRSKQKRRMGSAKLGKTGKSSEKRTRGF